MKKDTRILMFSFLTFLMACLLAVVIYDYNMGGFESIEAFVMVCVTASILLVASLIAVIYSIIKKDRQED